MKDEAMQTKTQKKSETVRAKAPAQKGGSVKQTGQHTGKGKTSGKAASPQPKSAQKETASDAASRPAAKSKRNSAKKKAASDPTTTDRHRQSRKGGKTSAENQAEVSWNEKGTSLKVKPAALKQEAEALAATEQSAPIEHPQREAERASLPLLVGKEERKILPAPPPTLSLPESTRGTEETGEWVSPTQYKLRYAEIKPPSVPPATKEEPTVPEPQYELRKKQRVEEITRTVQVSIEEVEEKMQEPTEAEDEFEPEESLGRRLGRGAARGAFGLLKWLLLVVFLVAVIAGCGVAWLYRGATPDLIPQFTVTLAGQELQPNAYEWNVPVVANHFVRSYSKDDSKKAQELEQVLEKGHPALGILPSGYENTVTLYDAQGAVLYEGAASGFESYVFTENGAYTLELKIRIPEENMTGSAGVYGEQTYRVRFSVKLRASVRLNRASIPQGEIAAVRVSGALDSEVPVLETALPHTAFVQTDAGWIAWLAIAREQPAENYEIRVHSQGYEETLNLRVSARDWGFRDYNRKSELTDPWIGPEDTSPEIEALLDVADETLYWKGSGFVQPFLSSITVTLPYGTTEYVGRTAEEKETGDGTGRTCENIVVTSKKGEELISPAAGRVLLAENLGGTALKTVVVEHGGGLKSIFYDLRTIEVKAGDLVKQGQTLGTINKKTVAEARLGRVAVEPLTIWRGQCDAMR